MLQLLWKRKGESEAFSRFRSALGRVAWLTQTRQDLRAYISALACQQSSPTNHTEAGLRSLLRYLQNDMLVAVRLPVENEVVVRLYNSDTQPTSTADFIVLHGKRIVCFADCRTRDGQIGKGVCSHAPIFW